MHLFLSDSHTKDVTVKEQTNLLSGQRTLLTLLSPFYSEILSYTGTDEFLNNPWVSNAQKKVYLLYGSVSFSSEGQWMTLHSSSGPRYSRAHVTFSV